MPDRDRRRIVQHAYRQELEERRRAQAADTDEDGCSVLGDG
jgi:hypothetical protein